jgi:hypothetical protein
MLTLLGLHDDYGHDGRTLVQLAQGWAVPPTVSARPVALFLLGGVYKQVNAPFGQFREGPARGRDQRPQERLLHGRVSTQRWVRNGVSLK